MKDYEKALAKLKPGDTIYELQAVYNYPEEGGGRCGIQVYTAVVKEIVTEHIETITHKTVNGNSVPEEKPKLLNSILLTPEILDFLLPLLTEGMIVISTLKM